MRAMLWGLVLLGLSLAGLTTANEMGLQMGADEFSLYRDAGLIALSVIVFVEGVWALVRRQPATDSVSGVLQSDASGELDLAQELATARSDAFDLRQKNQDLMAAVKQAEEQIAKWNQEKSLAAIGKGDQEVMNFVTLLQGKGRFVDFVMDDISKYADAQIGAAARVVHQGCSQVIRDYFEIKPVADDAEGATLTLDKDYDTHQFKLLGQIRGEPPFKGRVLHRGWRTDRIRLPEATVRSGNGQRVIAPAEVELHS